MISSDTWKGLALPVALIVIGEITGRMANLTDIDSLAPPSAILMAFFEAVADGSVLTTTRDTLVTAFTGLALGGSIGLLIGIVLGVLPTADRLMEVTIESIRPIPSIAILPIALIALGFGYRLEIAIISFACMWPLLILTRAAVRGVEPRLMEVSRALRLTPGARITKIVIPAALPRIFVAFRLAAGIALIVSVTVEIAINPLGLGHAIMTAQQALRPELMLAYLVWLGIVGWSLNAALCSRSSGCSAAPRWWRRRDERLHRTGSAILWRIASFGIAAAFPVADDRERAAGFAGLPARSRSGMGCAGARPDGGRSWRQGHRHAGTNGVRLAQLLRSSASRSAP